MFSFISYVAGGYYTSAKELAAHAVALIRGLHLLFEEYKLQQLHSVHLRPLARLLLQLSTRAGMRSFTEYYCCEFGDFCALVSSAAAPSSHSNNAALEPPSIYHWLSNCIRGMYYLLVVFPNAVNN